MKKQTILKEDFIMAKKYILCVSTMSHLEDVASYVEAIGGNVIEKIVDHRKRFYELEIRANTKQKKAIENLGIVLF